MNWDWRSTVGRFFGKAAVAPPPPKSADVPPDVAQSVQQLKQGKHRALNRAEIDSLAEITRDLQDIGHHNLVVIYGLRNAQPKLDNPQVTALTRQMKSGLVASYNDCETAMATLNDSANTLDIISARTAEAADASAEHSRLPVYDEERNHVINLGRQLSGIYQTHIALRRTIRETRPYVTLQAEERVYKALESNKEKLPQLLVTYARLADGILGIPEQPFGRLALAL